MGLRQSLDEGAGELGAAVAEEIPDSTEQLQAAIPDDAAALWQNGAPVDDRTLSVERVVAETPLDRYL